MNLKEVVHAGASGFMYTAISITFALGLGVLLGKMLQVGKTQSLLISFRDCDLRWKRDCGDGSGAECE